MRHDADWLTPSLVLLTIRNNKQNDMAKLTNWANEISFSTELSKVDKAIYNQDEQEFKQTNRIAPVGFNLGKAGYNLGKE